MSAGAAPCSFKAETDHRVLLFQTFFQEIQSGRFPKLTGTVDREIASVRDIIPDNPVNAFFNIYHIMQLWYADSGDIKSFWHKAPSRVK